MKREAVVLAVHIDVYAGNDEIAAVDVAADSYATYLNVRNALFNIPGATRMEIKVVGGRYDGRKAVYVPVEGTLFPVWRESGGKA